MIRWLLSEETWDNSVHLKGLEIDASLKCHDLVSTHTHTQVNNNYQGDKDANSRWGASQ